MDAKITLSFDGDIIDRAKKYADRQGISLSRLTEILLRKAASGSYNNIDDIPVSDWVRTVSEGEAEYKKSKPRKKLNDEYFKGKK